MTARNRSGPRFKAEDAERYRLAGVEPDASVSGRLDRAAQRWPGEIALSADGVAVSFSGLASAARRYAALLADGGVRPGDAVLIQLPNGGELVALVHAAWRLGAVPVPIVALYRERELASVVADCRPAAAIGLARRGERCPTAELDAALERSAVAPPARYSLGAAAGWRPLPALVDAAAVAGAVAPDAPSAAPIAPGRCALVLYTSGTTSEPKGVRHDSRSLLATVQTYRRVAGLRAGNVVGVPAPMAHIGAFVCGTLLPVDLGVRVTLFSRWQPAAAAEMIATEQVVFAAGATIMLADLVAVYETGAHPGARVTAFQTGAAAVTPELVERAQAVGVTAWRAWGMTECPSISTGAVATPLAQRARTDGRVEPGIEVRAVDPQGVPVADGVEGELCVRGAKLMLGYTRPELTAAQVDAAGWFHTGDLGAVRDGWVTVTGRLKDLINRGGEKFSARDIEDAICTHPAIAAAAVIGVPDERLGENVVAYLTTPPGQAYPGDEQLCSHLAAAGLARQKFPVAWRHVAALPYTATGKVEKRELLEQWEAEN